MRRLLALATEQPKRLLNTSTQSIDAFICQALRREPAPWPEFQGEIADDVVFDRCQHHGVQALLYHTMEQRDEWPTWPEALRQRLELSSKATIAKELQRTHELKKLLAAFRKHEIVCILTKGEALAETHYPTPGTRPRGDSDLFISMQDIERAKRVIEDAGFEIVSPVYKNHQFSVRKSGDDQISVHFDIHWRILNAPRFARSISFEEAYAKSTESGQLNGARMLSDTHALMLACMHRLGSKRHDRNRMIWIYDIHLLVSAMTVRALQEFVAESASRGVQPACREGLLLAQTYFHTEIPPEITGLLLSEPQLESEDSRRAESHFGLLVDDWKKLPDSGSRKALLEELFLPSGSYLLNKYQKSSNWWLPLLYVRQIVGGFAGRLIAR